ncbi:MAG: phenylacetate--CoA ligase family protein [Anaerolineales bacterium]|nr:phenylacetate--CoA ligase family protein [Anaerolineales bacterium]
MKTLSQLWSIMRASRADPETVAQLQQKRLAQLVSYARGHSPFYTRLLNDLPAHWSLTDIPPVTKTQLMAQFDDWVTDPSITQAEINTFIGDPARVGQKFKGAYTVWTTSGSTGQPSIFLHGAGASGLYDLLWLWRGFRPWLGLWAMPMTLRREFRETFVIATGGHFAGAVSAAHLGRKYRWLQNSIKVLSILSPLPELIQALNQEQPTLLTIYPSALILLAAAQSSGQLAIKPKCIITSGEGLTPAVQAQAEAAFGCPVREIYACSEAMFMAFRCEEGWLHLNADWYILEPVDEAYRPVPPGTPSHTVLLTNLANHIQPIIRYNLGDSITMRPDACSCGNPLPALRVEGRQGDILNFVAADGEMVLILPLALETVVENAGGVRHYQLIQTAPDCLTVRLEAEPGYDLAEVRLRIGRELERFLARQGVRDAIVRHDATVPQRDPRTGKYRQVWSELREPAGHAVGHAAIHRP